MATDFDPYGILGVDRGASADDVQAAYVRLRAEAPPGSGLGREVEAAYAVLGSEEKRREYDTRLSMREARGMLAASAESLTLAGEPTGYEDGASTPVDELHREINSLLRRGFYLETATADSAFLTKRNSFAWGWALLWFILGFLPFVTYLFYYFSRRVEPMYLWIDSTGVVHTSAVARGTSELEDVRWTPGDIAKALILPLLLIVLNVGAALATDVDTDDLTETDHIIGFGFGFVLEVALVALAFNFAVRKYKGSWRSLGFRRPVNMRWWFPLAILGGSFGTIWLWVGLLYALGIAPDSNIPENVYDFAIPVIMLGLLTVIVAPFAEEVFFRGFLFQGVAKRRGMWAGIGFSAFIFGLSHAGAPESWLLLPAIGAIGAIFAWGFAKSGSIYPSLFAHVVFNSVSFVIGFTA